MKSFDEMGNCRTLPQQFENLFGEKDRKIKVDAKGNNKEECKKQNEKLINNLFSCQDVLNFGIAYTGESSMSITGAVQICDGINKWEDTTVQTEFILSQFANSNKEETRTSTFGDRTIVDEAHYLYEFSLFPKEYEKFEQYGFNGYQEEDYMNFKEASLISVSNNNSKAKKGCKNEFAMFIEIKENYSYSLDLNWIQDDVKIIKGDKVDIKYDLTKLMDLLNIESVKEKIKSIEVYYNPRTTELDGDFKENVEKYDLITRDKIEE